VAPKIKIYLRRTEKERKFPKDFVLVAEILGEVFSEALLEVTSLDWPENPGPETSWVGRGPDRAFGIGDVIVIGDSPFQNIQKDFFLKIQRD